MEYLSCFNLHSQEYTLSFFLQRGIVFEIEELTLLLEYSECCVTLIYSVSGLQLFHYCSQIPFSHAESAFPEAPKINTSVRSYRMSKLYTVIFTLPLLPEHLLLFFISPNV